MWTAWTIFYISLWIMGSGFVIGGANKYTNIASGLILAILSFWIGVKYRRSLFIRPPALDKKQ